MFLDNMIPALNRVGACVLGWFDGDYMCHRCYHTFSLYKPGWVNDEISGRDAINRVPT